MAFLKKKENYFTFVTIALFIGIYLFLIFFTNPAFYLKSEKCFDISPAQFWQSTKPAFLLTSDFIKQHLEYPGGIITYISSALSHLYFYPLIGSLIVVLVLFFISFITRKIIKRAGNIGSIHGFHFIPPLLLCILHNRLEQPLAVELALLCSISAFYIYLRLNKYTKYRIALYFVSAVILYITTGSGFLIYSFMCGLYEMRHFKDRRGIITGCVYVACTLILPYISARFFYIVNVKDAYFSLLPFVPERDFSVISILLCTYYPITMIALLLNRNNVDLLKLLFIKSEKTRRLAIDSLQIFLIYLFIYMAVRNTFKNNEKRALLQADYYAQNKVWEEILKLAQDKYTSERMVSFYNNRALFHTGKLLQDMFSYSQYWGADGLFVDRLIHKSVCIHNSDLHFELGQINDSQRWAYEALTKYGPLPRIIRRLVDINSILGNSQATKNNLSVLKQSLYYQLWNQPAGGGGLTDKEIASIRMGLPVTKYFLNSGKPDVSLKELLKSDPGNRMAFEYLIAYYLLKHDYKNVIDLIGQFRALKYRSLPRPIEEAVILHQELAHHDTLDLQGYTISGESEQRFHEYFSILRAHSRDRTPPRKELEKKFSDTYWFYLQFLSPIKNNRKFDYKSDDNWKPL
jgi:hypothetical protein